MRVLILALALVAPVAIAADATLTWQHPNVQMFAGRKPGKLYTVCG